MSLYIAKRGEKAYLREAWSAKEFDFGAACRRWGRNDAVWLLCYRLHLAGIDLPDDRQARRIVRDANRATGGLDSTGRRDRYTLYEARKTIEQVARYEGRGLAPLLARPDGRTDLERRLLRAIRSVARSCSRHTFTASYRQLSRMSGVPLIKIASVAASLEQRRLAWRVGESPRMPGRARGTTIWSIRPPRPRQRIDESSPPTYDAVRCRWTWATPSDRGRITAWAYLRGAKRFVDMPNVIVPSAFWICEADQSTQRLLE